ncbi:hypothetical protein CJF30_00001684 [Rutstroemia sp. NJR-2017a BBW]|nr:hypothetical protein CJF30_00001684 [Rutstroemia sp. NJR-2017a BBW]
MVSKSQIALDKSWAASKELPSSHEFSWDRKQSSILTLWVSFHTLSTCSSLFGHAVTRYTLLCGRHTHDKYRWFPGAKARNVNAEIGISSRNGRIFIILALLMLMRLRGSLRSLSVTSGVHQEVRMRRKCVQHWGLLRTGILQLQGRLIACLHTENTFSS